MLNSQGFLLLNSINETFSTRISLTVKTIIDHFITNIHGKNYSLTYFDVDTCLSDHRALIMSIDQNHSKNIVPIYKKVVINYDHIISPQFQSHINESTTFDSFLKICKNSIENNKITYTFKSKSTPRKPYVPKQLLCKIKEKHKLLVLHKKK